MNENYQNVFTSHILWFSDRLHNTLSAESNILVENYLCTEMTMIFVT